MISRRRLLQVAAYSVPAMTVINVAGPARVLAMSHGGGGCPALLQTWTDVTGVPSPPWRYAAAMVSCLGKIHLFGGGDGGSILFNDVWRLNPSGNSWSGVAVSGTPPAGRAYSAMAAGPDDMLYLFGGGDFSATYFGDTWRFDPSTDTWTDVTPSPGSPPPRKGHAMARGGNGQIYMFGGFNYYNGGHQGDTWRYDVNAGTWTNVTTNSGPNPPARYGHAMAASIDGSIYLFGGNGTSGICGDTWRFDPSSETWTQLSPALSPSPRYYIAMAAEPVSGRIYLFGGQSDMGWASDTWCLDPFASPGPDWTQVTAVNTPAARVMHSLAGIDCKVYMFGGTNPADTWVLG